MILLVLKDDPGCAWRVQVHPAVYSDAGHAQFKGMPGVRWVRSRGALNGRGYYAGAHEAVLPIVVTLVEAKVARVRDERTEQQTPRALVACPPSFRPYQVTGARWAGAQLVTSGAAFLADEMGLGKSAQAITAMGSVAGSALVVCPAIVRTHWAAQVEQWAPGTSTRWRILSYEGFRSAVRGGTKKIPPLEPVRGVIFDEIHYLSNARAQRSKLAASWLASATPRPLVVGLSGTPMLARPRDLWHPLDLLWPGRFGRFWEFTRRYCDGQWVEIPGTDRTYWKSDGVSREPELAGRLREVMLRRTKAEVGAELPKLTRVCLEVEIPAKARRDLRKAAAALASGNAIRGALSSSEDHKIKAAIELATDVVANGSRPLLLTTRKETARQLSNALAFGLADGDTPPDRRRTVLDQGPGGVSTVFAVTTGIDLVSFDVVIFVGLDWLPSTLLQAEARTHRIGQTRGVTAYYLIGTGTLDEVIRERVIDRLDVWDRLGGGESSGLAGDLGGGTEEDLIAAIVEQASAA